MTELKPKLERFAQGIAVGQTQSDAALYAGYKGKNVHVTGHKLAKNALVSQRIAEIMEEHRSKKLVTAAELHEQWSQMARADIQDILNDDGHYKPITQWPKIWRQMLSGVDVKELFERSKDGGNSSWDKIGEVVKLKFVSVKELGELLGRHKAVDAFVAQKSQVDLNINLGTELSQALAAGRERARLTRSVDSETIEVSPLLPEDGDQP